MAEKDFYSDEYEPWRGYIRRMRKKNSWSWDETRLLGKADENMCRQLRQKKVDDEDDYYAYLSDEDWNDFIDYLQDEDEKVQPCTIGGHVTEEHWPYRVPQNPLSAWKCYSKMLQEKNFAPSAIHDVEKASNKILQQLQDGSQENDKTVHGLVIGNVQSGKTANMEGLMSMAADAGFNLFIILSGTIENLRQQTRSRFASDLRSKSCQWKPIDQPDTHDPDKNPSNLDFSQNSSARYYTVCLKNSRRLEKLLYWLNYDVQKKKQMKVLLIDDESDQASLNTKKMDDDLAEEQERTAINNIIMRIVNGNTSKDSGEKVPYKAMNYVAYTATPYGNVLNENGEDSLYPSDFITLLAPPDTYFGPKQIFGDSVNGTTDPLPIVNEITVPLHDKNDATMDTSIIESIKDAWEETASSKKLPDIPQTLKEAIAWFVIATAIRRHDHSKKPVSMLVHHSMKTVYHVSTATAIRQWYQRTSMDDFIRLCEKVYQTQKKKLSRELFANIWPSYGRSCGISLPGGIDDYMPFDELISYIQNIKESGIEHITIKPDGNEYQFTEGIHLCVDNSSGETVGSNADVQVRLLYPQAADKVCDAPAFLVVGGNTLSRGLTLEGLVCTYFSRDVSQADTLMQMGRWFGYRRGYELLPRIWMTRKGLERFEELSALDIQLRSDIQNRYMDDNLTPAECGPMVAKTVQLALTSRNKMQGAEELNIDFSGQHLQTFKFPLDESKLEEAWNRANKFLDSLEAGDKEDTEDKENCRIWRNVSFDTISEQLLNTEVFLFGHHRKASEFCEEYRQTENYSNKWNVILQGTKSAKSSQGTKSDSSWHGVGKITRSRLKENLGDSELFSIGILSDPTVWRSDIPKNILENLTDAEKKIIAKGTGKKQTNVTMAEFRQLQDKIRQRAGIADIPRLVIYCIDHKSKARSIATNRESIGTSIDVIGVEILMPKRNGAWTTGFQQKR